MKKLCLLTFDDAPSTEVGDLLAALRQYGLTAIFFCTGELIENQKQALIDAVREGHILASHGWNHTAFSKLTLEESKVQLEKTEFCIDTVYAEALVTRKCRFFRFPYGDKGGGIGNRLTVFKSFFHPHRLALRKLLRCMNFQSPRDLGIQMAKVSFPYTLFDNDPDWFWSIDTKDWRYAENQNTKPHWDTWVDVKLAKARKRSGVEIILGHDQLGTSKLWSEALLKIANEYIVHSLA